LSAADHQTPLRNGRGTTRTRVLMAFAGAFFFVAASARARVAARAEIEWAAASGGLRVVVAA
jgi:hypothetical protein